jgi:DNA-binding HxlR family transcriptional regulator
MNAQQTKLTALETPEVSDHEMVCATREALALLSGKWSVEVLYLLASGTRRYSEVLYDIGEISKKTLTQTLRALERQDLVARRVYPEVPPRVEYSLTSLGWSLTSVLMGLYEWSAEHLGAGRPRPRRLTAMTTPQAVPGSSSPGTDPGSTDG